MAYAENYGITPSSSNLAFNSGSLYNAANVGIAKPLGSTLAQVAQDVVSKTFNPSNYHLDPYIPTTAGDTPADSPKPRSPVYGGHSPVNSAPQLDYYLADIAKHYGMDKATAYQEALANSSYQRAVADLREAGLNPVLAMGKVQPSDSFTGTFDAPSGGGGGVGRRNNNKSTDWVKVIGQVAKVATSAAAIVRVAGMFA